MPRQTQAIEVNKGLAGTLEMIDAFVRQAIRKPQIYDLIAKIRQYLPDRLYVTPDAQDEIEIMAAHEWVMKNIRYSRDCSLLETVRDIEVVLKHREGDCDCMVALLAAMIIAMGHKVRIWLAGDTVPKHIYLVAYTSKVIGKRGEEKVYEGIVLDPTLKGRPAGSVSRWPNHWEVYGYLEKE